MKKTLILLSLCATALFAGQSAIIDGLKNGGGLSLREKAVDGKVIGKLQNGDKVIISETQGKWHHVKVLKNGQEGWAHSGWVKALSTSQKAAPVVKKAVVKKVVVKKAVIKKAVVKKTTQTHSAVPAKAKTHVTRNASTRIGNI